jgi:chondroitin-sulfate-ABC endolyase/exolyase
MMKQILTIVVPLFIALCANAQYMQLEKEVPSNWETTKGGKLSISKQHYKLGNESVRWDWKRVASLLLPSLKACFRH